MTLWPERLAAILPLTVTLGVVGAWWTAVGLLAQSVRATDIAGGLFFYAICIFLSVAIFLGIFCTFAFLRWGNVDRWGKT